MCTTRILERYFSSETFENCTSVSMSTYAFFPISYGYEINLRLSQHQYNNRTLLEPFVLGSNKLATIRKLIKFWIPYM